MSYSLKLELGDPVIIYTGGQWLDGIVQVLENTTTGSGIRHNWLGIRTSLGHYHTNLIGDYEFKRGGSYNLMVIKKVAPNKPK